MWVQHHRFNNPHGQNMRLSDIKLGVSPLTDRVMLGTLINETTWRQKRDATNDFCGILLTWCEPGTVRTIKNSTGETFEIIVRKVGAKKGEAGTP